MDSVLVGSSFDKKQLDRYETHMTRNNGMVTADGKTFDGLVYVFSDFKAAKNKSEEIKKRKPLGKFFVATFDPVTGDLIWL